MASLLLTQQTQLKNVDVVTPTIVSNCTSSATLMKELTVVAISTLTLLKNNFPKDNNYVENNFGGIPVWVLKNDCGNKIAQFVSDSIRSSFDAIDKQYLHQLALCFYKDGSSLENLLEFYLFEYDYKKEEMLVSGNSENMDNSTKFTFKDVKKSTIKMVQACSIMARGFPSLPEGYDIIIRLYYNSDAPKEYQSPGFKTGDKRDDNLLSVREDQWDSMMMGSVATPFHQLSLCAYAKGQLTNGSCEVNLSATPWIDSEDFLTPVVEKESVELICPCQNLGKFAESLQNNKRRKILLIKCIYCNTYQHATCFGVLAEDIKRRDVHCCNICYEENTARKPTDYNLYKTGDDVLAVYIFRHVLQLCTQMQSINQEQLMSNFGLAEKRAKDILRTFAKNKIIEKNDHFGLITPHKILKDGLKKMMEIYFYQQETDLAKQLLMEIDPLEEGDILSDLATPLQSISLNDSKLYKIVEKENKKPETSDATMEEFRKAILRENEPISDELPLSGSHNPVNLKERTSFKRKLHSDKKDVKAKKVKTVRFNLND